MRHRSPTILLTVLVLLIAVLVVVTIRNGLWLRDPLDGLAAWLGKSRYEALTLIVSAAGPLVGVIGFWLVTRQLTQARKQIQLAAVNSVTAQVFQLSQLLIEHPELAPYFCPDRKTSQGTAAEVAARDSAVLRHKVAAACQLHIDVFD